MVNTDNTDGQHTNKNNENNTTERTIECHLPIRRPLIRPLPIAMRQFDICQSKQRQQPIRQRPIILAMTLTNRDISQFLKTC